MNTKRLIVFITFLIPLYCLPQKTLEYYLSNAISSSPLLNDYRNQLLSNSIDNRILKAAMGIQVTAGGNSYYAPVIRKYGYDEAITNGAQVQALVTATKSLLPKKYLSLQFKDLQIIDDSIHNASKISEQDLKKAIIDQYIITYGEQLQIDFNTQLHNLLQQQEVVLKRITQKNIYKQVDYLSFLVTYQQQDLVRQQLEVQYRSDFATLNYLAGIFDTTILMLAPPGINPVKIFYFDSSVFFVKYKIDSLRLTNSKTVIALGYRPHFNLYADGGYQSSLAFQPYRNFGTSLGVSLVVPIFDGGQRKLQYLKIDNAEKTRLKNKEFFRNQYYQQIAQLEQELSGIENLLPAINKQIEYSETLIQAYGKLLETGDIRISDYVLALDNYMTAKNLIVQNMISRYQVINQLNYWNR